MATAGQNSLVAVLRRQLVSDCRIELPRAHVAHHLLARRRMRMRLMAVVVRHRVRRRRQRGSHGLLMVMLLMLLLLRLGWRLLRSICGAYWR
jgi:hypothetical protein